MLFQVLDLSWWAKSHFPAAQLCGCVPKHAGPIVPGEERGMQTPAQQEGGLLESIAEFCRISGMAESTFGRRAVNDGKLVARLRDGARITPETLDRVSRYMALR